LFLLFCNAWGLDFEKLVRENASNPSELISKLRDFRGNEVADAFLAKFGGDSFQNEEGASLRSCSGNPEVDFVVRSAARYLGEEMYKVGAKSWNDDGTLEIAQRFLSEAGSDAHPSVDDDVEPSFLLQRVNGLLDFKRASRMAFQRLSDDCETRNRNRSPIVEDRRIDIRNRLLALEEQE
jgi:hypothetical protein